MPKVLSEEQVEQFHRGVFCRRFRFCRRKKSRDIEAISKRSRRNTR